VKASRGLTEDRAAIGACGEIGKGDERIEGEAIGGIGIGIDRRPVGDEAALPVPFERESPNAAGNGGRGGGPRISISPSDMATETLMLRL
jgi:hypothetical protein